jgi:transcriptional regulator with XRE-family HTH domain
MCLRIRRTRSTVIDMWEPAESAVQEMREALGLSIRSLSRAANVSPGYLSRYERGLVRPTRHWLRRVATTLGQLLARHHEKDTK